MEEGSDPDMITVKVTDFGFATQFTPEGMNEILGSPLYMASEIVLGEAYDAKVDVWAIGCIAYIMLTGSPPFWGKTQNDVYKAIVQKTPTFGKSKKLLSEDAMQFTMACLAKDPSERSSAE